MHTTVCDANIALLNLYNTGMGLCKCPLKKVTNLFCFEHRVNVCDSCLLSNHAQVIIHSHVLTSTRVNIYTC